MRCPVCDSTKAKLKIVKKSRRLVKFCKPICYTKKVSYCSSCHSSIDLSDDDYIEREIIKAKQEAIPKLLKMLEKKGYKLASIQRIFGLPQTTLLRKDKSKEYIQLVFAFLSILIILSNEIDVAIIDTFDGMHL